MYELPKTIPAVEMLLALEELGLTILFLLKKWISKASRLVVRSSLSFNCPITVP
jgi:hypothetical protein